MNSVTRIGIIVSLFSVCMSLVGCSCVSNQVVYDVSHNINGYSDASIASLSNCQNGQKDDCDRVVTNLKAISAESKSLMELIKAK